MSTKKERELARQLEKEQSSPEKRKDTPPKEPKRRQSKIGANLAFLA